jgi:hypothetical protein
MKSHICVLSVLVAICWVEPALANSVDINRQEIAVWNDPLTLPQTRTDCIGYASGDWPWPATGGWKTCNQWRTQTRVMQVHASLITSGPADLSAEAKNASITCAVVAGVAAAGGGVASGGSAAATAAKVAFSGCMTAKGYQIADEYQLRVETVSGWTDWG